MAHFDQLKEPSWSHKNGHGTRAVLALVDIAGRLDPRRGVLIQSTITRSGKALGRKLVERHNFTVDSYGENFYSSEPR